MTGNTAQRAEARPLLITSIGAMIVVSATLAFVAPWLAQSFRDMGTSLPLGTQALLTFGSNPLLLAVPPVLLATLMVTLWRRKQAGAFSVMLGSLAYSVILTGLSVSLFLLPLIKVIP